MSLITPRFNAVVSALAIGRSLATIAYAQLVAENAVIHRLPPHMVSVIFHVLVMDLGASAAALASLSRLDPPMRDRKSTRLNSSH